MISANTEVVQLGFNEMVPIYLASDPATLQPHMNKEGTTEVTAGLNKEVKVQWTAEGGWCARRTEQSSARRWREWWQRQQKEGKELEINEQQREDDVRAVIDDLLDEVDSTHGMYQKYQCQNDIPRGSRQLLETEGPDFV